jgi:hypothetical protein
VPLVPARLVAGLAAALAAVPAAARAGALVAALTAAPAAFLAAASAALYRGRWETTAVPMTPLALRYRARLMSRATVVPVTLRRPASFPLAAVRVCLLDPLGRLML